MKRKILTTILILANLFLYATDYNAKAIISKDKAFVGDVLKLDLIVNSELKPEELAIASDEKWSVKKLRAFNAIEGSENTYVATYQFVPITNDTLKIPSFVVENSNGENFISEPLFVEVEQPESSNEMILQVDCSPKKVYVGQVLNIHYVWKSLHPLNTIKSVNIQIPNFDDENFRAFPNANYINAEDKSAIGLPVHERRLVGKTEILGFDKTRRAYCVSFETIAIPLKAGTLEIQAPTLVCAVPKERDVSAGVPQRFVARRFLYPAYFDNEFFNYQTEVSNLKKQFVKGKSLEIEVLPLPNEGMPKDFSYIVGNYKINASIPETNVRVGDTIELSINIESLEKSSLENVNLSTENFKERGFDKFEFSEEFLGTVNENKKNFKVKLLVRSIESTKIPAVTFSFFNPSDEKYHSLKTQEINLRVSPSQSSRILAEDGTEILIKTKLTKNKAGIYDTQVDENFFTAKKKPFIGNMSLAEFLLISLITPIAFLSVFITRAIKKAILSSTKFREKLAFYLKVKSISLKTKVSAKEIEAIIQEVFSLYIKAKKESMSFVEIKDFLEGKNCPVNLIEQLALIFEKLRDESYAENKKYSANKNLLKETIKLLKKINRNLK